MKRLLPLLMIVMLIAAACGGSESVSTASPTNPGQAEVELSATPTEPADSTSNATPSISDSPTQEGSAGESESSRTEEGDDEATPVGSSPADSPEPDPTGTPVNDIRPATATPTTGESDPVVFPAFPPVPEITSCVHAADVSIERIQFWLDAMALVPEESIWDDGLMSEEFEEFSAQMDEQMSEIEEQAEALGCSDAEMEALLFERLDRLVANNPNAELILEMLQEMALEEVETPTPPDVLEPTEEPVTVTIASCEDAADLFIERMQVLVLDALADMTVEELDGMINPPASILQFVEEMTQLQLEFQAIGCSDREVTALVGERLDQLVVEGPAAQEIYDSLEEAVAKGNLFDDLN